MSNQSPNINELATALSKAQAEIIGAVKDSANPYFKSSYADLGSVMDAIRAPLTKNGISYTQTTDIREGQLVLITTLMHSGGQWISGLYPINPVKADPQSMGSAITYARRYALTAICGVAQIDDDGEAAMARPVLPNGNVAPLVRPEQPGPQDGDPNATFEFTMRLGTHKKRKLPEIERILGGLPAMAEWHEKALTSSESKLKAGKITADEMKIWQEDLAQVAAYIGRRELEMARELA